ncbi:MAG: sigma-70 family RNA polymerase sigma factor [Phycisphaeraceae bacterium]|nr:sigma-70 family RNA polymerase sigma factor [Phycisphaerales bacterium]MCB9858944.1 sigma-70 family RNA polymerase sigma factor [Phycisphaeraceae bacterium]
MSDGPEHPPAVEPITDPARITSLLGAIETGSTDAAEQLYHAVYSEMRRLAQSMMSSERPNHTLQATALVHEAYLKLLGSDQVMSNRDHFMACAARAMRRILVDHARSKNRIKRGGNHTQTALDETVDVYESCSGDLALLDDALTQLAAFDAQKARLVELRFFGQMRMEDAATLLGLSKRTAEREWTLARAWLKSHMDTSSEDVTT